MRHKRLSRAEEKAYALPAKLSVPMMVCIFPVIFVVILLPVYREAARRQFLSGENHRRLKAFSVGNRMKKFVNHHALA